MSFGPDRGTSGNAASGGSESAAGKTNASGSHASGGSSAQAHAGSDANDGGSGSPTGAAGEGDGDAGADGGGKSNDGGSSGSASGGGGSATGGRPAGGQGGNAAAGSASGAGGSAMAGTGGGGSAGADGGTCTTGFFSNHTYAFCGVVASAAVGRAKCESLGLAVVSIQSRMENDYVASKQGSTWLDASDEEMEGEWRWVSTNTVFWSKKPLPGQFANFSEGQPNNKDKDGNPENCLALTSAGWNDVGCNLGDFTATCESEGLLPEPPTWPWP